VSHTQGEKLSRCAAPEAKNARDAHHLQGLKIFIYSKVRRRRFKHPTRLVKQRRLTEGVEQAGRRLGTAALLAARRKG
jgi:hypothetical protein